MKYIFILISLLLTISFSEVSAQPCNDELVNVCALKAGDNYMYIQNFKVKLPKFKKGKPEPMMKYSVVLKKDMLYRFNICSSTDMEGEAVLQLYDSERMIASNVNLNTGATYGGFDFSCKKSSIYYVVIAFKEGKEGCAVGLLSMFVKK